MLSTGSDAWCGMHEVDSGGAPKTEHAHPRGAICAWVGRIAAGCGHLSEARIYPATAHALLDHSPESVSREDSARERATSHEAIARHD